MYSSISCLTSSNSRTSRNSRLNSLFQYISSITKIRFSSSHLFDNRNFLFTNSFLFSNCSSFFNLAFSFNSSLYSTFSLFSSNSREKHESNSNEKEDSNEKKNYNQRELHASFTVDKIRAVLKYMKNLRIKLCDLIQEIVKTSSIQKNQLIRKSKLICFLLSSFNDVLNSRNWDQEKYKKKLRFIFENKYFKN